MLDTDSGRKLTIVDSAHQASEGGGPGVVQSRRRGSVPVREGWSSKDGIIACFRKRRSLLLPLFLLAALVLNYALQANSSGDVAAVATPPDGERASDVPTPPPKPLPVVLQATVKEGETISSLLGEWLSPREIDLLAGLCKEVFPLRKIRRGRPYLVRTLDNVFQSFEYEIDNEEKLVIRAEPEGFAVAREPIDYQTETVLVCGTIQSSLFEAADGIGEIPVLALRLADIFGWDVDFVLDVRAGDSFKAVVEKRYRNGEFAGYGRIPAAEFVNQGNRYQAFLFENADGNPEYYDAKGRSLRRAFLKTPLEYARISSGFSWHRFHPIKKEWCPHPAIDYAAPVGTPVRTVGDGVVLETGRDGASGRYIKIRHNSAYQTSYAHLSRFAGGIKRGRRVHQGQVIGYVGSSGMSTGPHLDFRMKKNGQYVNPRKIIAPASPPVPRERIEAFRDTVDPLLAQLDAVKAPVAMETSDTLGGEPHGENRDGAHRDRPAQDGCGGP